MNESFSEQQKEVLHLLKILDDNGVLPHLIIAGSWAEYVYSQANVLPGFSLALRTVDVDFLVKNMRRPTTPISVPAIAKEEGYSIEYDVLMGTTKLHTPGGLEIEFLINQLGSGVNRVLNTNLGVNAQALRHLGHIINNAISVDLFGMKVQVPCPEGYVLHKMLINDVRQEDKKAKDRGSIARLLPYIDFEKLNVLYQAYTKNEKKRVKKFIEQFGEEVCEDLQLDRKIKFTELAAGNNASENQSRNQNLVR